MDDRDRVLRRSRGDARRTGREQGARRLHVVDLNGAVAGKPRNEAAIKDDRRRGRIPTSRSSWAAASATSTPSSATSTTASRYVIIGTAAVKNPGFLHDACDAFPGHIMVGLDAKDGKVAIDGWSKLTGHDVIDLAKNFQDYGVEAVIYTDIGRDGMLTGVNIEATVRARAGAHGAGDRERRPQQPRGRASGSARSSPRASPAPSPGARSTRARSTSPRR